MEIQITKKSEAVKLIGNTLVILEGWRKLFSQARDPVISEKFKDPVISDECLEKAATVLAEIANIINRVCDYIIDSEQSILFKDLWKIRDSAQDILTEIGAINYWPNRDTDNKNISLVWFNCAAIINNIREAAIYTGVEIEPYRPLPTNNILPSKNESQAIQPLKELKELLPPDFSDKQVSIFQQALDDGFIIRNGNNFSKGKYKGIEITKNLLVFFLAKLCTIQKDAIFEAAHFENLFTEKRLSRTKEHVINDNKHYKPEYHEIEDKYFQ